MRESARAPAGGDRRLQPRGGHAMFGELRHLGAALVLAAGTSGGLAAATSYVPLPGPQPGAAAGHAVQVTVTNPGSVTGTVEAVQMGRWVEGAPRVAAAPSRH